MHEKHQHVLIVIDFVATNHNTIFVKITGYDAVLEKEFKGEVKFLSGKIFGDLIHSQRSTLSPECREFVRGNLLNRFNEGQFN